MLLFLCVLSIIKSRFFTGTTGDMKFAVESLMMATDDADESTETEDADASNSHVVDLSKPVCYESSRRSDTCEARGDIRVHGASQTVYVYPMQQEWKIKPYARKHDPFALDYVKQWSIKPFFSSAGSAAATPTPPSAPSTAPSPRSSSPTAASPATSSTTTPTFWFRFLSPPISFVGRCSSWSAA
uniref:Uncharacterized protein n=1 Tax=Ananas comosus var. bracteatus TaxID=296719 RepID=A0A6V7NVY8_ANACO|nr:unnamed protein product [Ananas comosus var. bracteatus]